MYVAEKNTLLYIFETASIRHNLARHKHNSHYIKYILGYHENLVGINEEQGEIITTVTQKERSIAKT